MNLQPLLLLTGLAFFCCVYGLKCYVCRPAKGNAREVDDLFPKRPPLPCSLFNTSEAFQYQCPEVTSGCITKVYGNDVMRSCTTWGLKDCKTLNQVLICICNSDLCNQEISPEEESSQEPPKGGISLLNDSASEATTQDTSDSFSLLNRDNKDKLENIGGGERQQEKEVTAEADRLPIDDEDGSEDHGSGSEPETRNPPLPTSTTTQRTMVFHSSSPRTPTKRPNESTQAKDAASQVYTCFYVVFTLLFLQFQLQK